MRAILRFRFAWSSLVAIGAVSTSAACSSGDSTGSSGNSGGNTGTSTSGSSGSAGSSSTGTTRSTGSAGSAGSTGSTGTTGGTGSASGTTGTTISFSSTIVPIFQSNCTTSGLTCHGDLRVTTQPQQRPYLGPQPGATVVQSTLMTIWSGLMVNSAEDPSMPLVSPGSDTNSFLMHKVDDTINTLDCSEGDDDGECGLPMPYSASILPQATRDTIRAWINGGAPQNN